MNTFALIHFLRPWCLLLLLPALALALLLLRQRSSGANWRRAIAPELLDYLIERTHETPRRWPMLLLAGWSIAITALAGPTWEKMPQPVLQKRDGLVIVLDLSLSMYAQDIQPSRLQRARYKVLDILQRRREGLTGLVVYSADAHVVAPLTDDIATIANLVPALSPAMMPAYGSDPVTAIDSAEELLRNAGFEHGRVVLISDEISADNVSDIAARFSGKPWQLSMIGVGTEQGAPIPLPNNQNNALHNSGFIKQPNGTIAVAQLHRERFAELAQKIGARYSDIRLDDGDLDTVLPNAAASVDEVRTVQREFDQWRERGPQLMWLLLPFAALAFRRGWLLVLLLLPISMPSQAVEWSALWKTPDQRAQQLFREGNAKTAAEQFRDPAWRGAAQYRAGDYQNAAQSLADIDNADAHYNRGNALARAGKLTDALAAYDAALKKNPQMEDAKVNRALIEKLLRQQKNSSPTNSSTQNSSRQDNQQQSSQQRPNSQDAHQREANRQQADQQQAEQQRDNGNSQSQQNSPSDTASSSPQQQRDKNTVPIANDADKKNSDYKQSAARARNESDQRRNAEPENANDKPTTAQPSSETPRDDQHNTQAQSAQDNSQQMQQRATEQWLRQIPDDPSGLLRRKFLYENRQRERNAAPRSDQPGW